jgi:hypothetical protein
VELIWFALAGVVIYILIRTHQAKSFFEDTKEREIELRAKLKEVVKAEEKYEDSKKKFLDFAKRIRDEGADGDGDGPRS